MRHELTGRRDLSFSRWHRRTFGDDAMLLGLRVTHRCERETP